MEMKRKGFLTILDKRLVLVLSLIGFFLTSLTIKMVDVWQPIESLLNLHVVDDFFYYLQVATNIAQGGSSSLDGINPTNGFHPLFMAVLVFLEPYSGGDKSQFVHLALSILVVCHVLTAMFLGLAGQKLIGNSRASVGIALLWLLWPLTQPFPMMGMESSLLSCFMASTFYAFLRIDGSLRNDLFLGVSLTLVFFARTDAALLVIILNGFLLYRFYLMERLATKVVLRRLISINIITVILAGAYVVGNVVSYGHPVQMSGRVKSVRTLGPHWQENMNSFEKILRITKINLLDKNSTGHKRFRRATMILFVLLLAEIVAARSRKRRWLPEITRGEWLVFVAAMYLYFLAFRGEVFTWWYPAHLMVMVVLFVRFSRQLSVPVAIPWLVYAILVHLYYITGQGYFDSYWYLLQWTVVSAIYVGVWISKLFSVLPNKLVTAIVLSSVVYVIVEHESKKPLERKAPRPTYFLYEVAQWANTNLPEDVSIGAYNAGVLAYFSRNNVTNLDGVINNSSGSAIVNHKLGKYVEDSKIEYLLDYKGSIYASVTYAQDNFIRRLFRPVHNFGNPSTWKGGGDVLLLKRKKP